MKDARLHNPKNRLWRLRYINERSGCLNVRYFNTIDGLRRFLMRIDYDPDFMPLDYQFWDLSDQRWTLSTLVLF